MAALGEAAAAAVRHGPVELDAADPEVREAVVLGILGTLFAPLPGD